MTNTTKIIDTYASKFSCKKNGECQMENVAQQKHLFWTLTWGVLLFILGIGMLGCPDEQATFSYSVTIKPEEAVKDGAKWRIDQGT